MQMSSLVTQPNPPSAAPCPPVELTNPPSLLCGFQHTEARLRVEHEGIDCSACVTTMAPSTTTTTTTPAPTTTCPPVVSQQDSLFCYFSTVDFNACSQPVASMDPFYCQFQSGSSHLASNLPCQCVNFAPYDQAFDNPPKLNVNAASQLPTSIAKKTTTPSPTTTTQETTSRSPTTTTQETITKTSPMTTQYPFKCYYSQFRDPQLSGGGPRHRRSVPTSGHRGSVPTSGQSVPTSGHRGSVPTSGHRRSVPTSGHRSKRLAFSSHSSVDCQYPGVVTLLKDAGQTTQKVVGSGFILDKSHVLLSQIGRIQLESTSDQKLTVHSSTYDLTSVDTTHTVRPTDGTDLVATNNKMTVYSVTPPFNFDTSCTLPSCFPNERMDTADLALHDCRAVASGVYDDSDMMNPLYQTSVRKVDVKVVTRNVTHLTLSRVDEKPNIMCDADGGASVICPLKSTGEWVTIGMGDGMAVLCSSDTPLVVTSEFHNLLPGSAAYTALQTYHSFP
ncbi:hypothetical protein ACOMHN_002741 [Nucella lapillus]